MTVEAEILATTSQMPESLKQEILHYAKYLLEKYSTTETAKLDVEQPKKKRGALGIWKDKIWISDDFDEPLEDFKEYM